MMKKRFLIFLALIPVAQLLLGLGGRLAYHRFFPPVPVHNPFHQGLTELRQDESIQNDVRHRVLRHFEQGIMTLDAELRAHQASRDMILKILSHLQWWAGIQLFVVGAVFWYANRKAEPVSDGNAEKSPGVERTQ